MSILGWMLIIGLGSFKVTELYKEITSRIGLYQVAWWKSTISIVAAGILTLLVHQQGWQNRVLLALGAAGVAALAHAVDTLLRHHRDNVVAEVLTKGRPRRR